MIKEKRLCYGAYSKGQFLKFNKVRYLPTGKGRRAVKLLVLFSLQALLLWTQKLFFMAIYLLSQMRYIFAACHASYAQKRYNLPCGRLRYDINPLHAPQGISHRRYIARDSVYRKSRKGFISLRSVLKGTTHTRTVFLFISDDGRPSPQSKAASLHCFLRARCNECT